LGQGSLRETPYNIDSNMEEIPLDSFTKMSDNLTGYF
jgi:hypothetical protein